MNKIINSMKDGVKEAQKQFGINSKIALMIHPDVKKMIKRETIIVNHKHIPLLTDSSLIIKGNPNIYICHPAIIAL